MSRLYGAGEVHEIGESGGFVVGLTSLPLRHVLLDGYRLHPSKRPPGRTPGCIPS